MENKPAKLKSRPSARFVLAGVFLVLLLAVGLPFVLRVRAVSIGWPPADNSPAVSAPAGEGDGTGISGTGGALQGSNLNSGASLPDSRSAAVSDNPNAAPADNTGSGGSARAIRGDYPVRLIIPALGVNAGVERVGVNSEGNMRAPANAADVAWYELGPMPGDKGNAVMAGHINTRYSAHGVFEHLDNLNTGGTITVERADGSRLSFVVTSKEDLDYNTPASAVFGGTSGKNLVLITCAGTWMPGKHVYDKRLVIFAALQ